MLKSMNDYILQHRRLENKRYYVYVHRKMTNNEIFYVGKGCGSRAWNSHGRNKYWQNIVNKHGYSVEVVEDCLEESVSLEREVHYIKILGERYKLANFTNGGDSPVFNEESRKKMSMARKGRKLTEAHKQALRESYKRTDHTKAIEASRKKSVDSNLYVFENIETLEIFEGTRKELCQKFNLNEGTLRVLFTSKPRKQSQKWRLISGKEKETNLE